jgi:hypothetical protein
MPRVNILEQVEEFIDEVEVVYFAGGEPLIMDEHYRVLEMLEERQAYHVKLRYNTNFSEMKYKGTDVMKIWDKFEKVEIGASLDASWKRGEYMRKEQDWNQVEANRRRMFEVCPNVYFFISCTVGLMNIWHLPDFYLEWCEKGFIRDPKKFDYDFHLNPLHFPAYLNSKCLPEHFKEEITKRYQKLLIHPADDERLAGKFQNILNFMWKEDMSNLLPNFIYETERLDKIRNENFWAVFPELEFLQEHRDGKILEYRNIAKIKVEQITKSLD